MRTTLFILLGVILGCSENTSPVGPLNKKMGRFAIARTVPSSAALYKTAADTFNIGDTRTSRSLYFLIENVGDYDINGVTVNTVATNLDTRNQAVASLKAAGTTSIKPLITVDVLHGKSLSGTGDAPILTPGVHHQVFSLVGRTFDGNDSVSTSLDVEIVCNALVTDISIFESGWGEHNYVSYMGNSTPSGGHSTQYSLRGDAQPDSIFNTGNTTITVQMYNGSFISPSPEAPVVLLPGQGMGLPTYGYPYLSLDGGGAAVKVEKGLRLDVDGKVYIVFDHLRSF